MSFINKFEVKRDLNNREYYNLIVHMDKLPNVPTTCIFQEDGMEYHYGEDTDGFVSFFVCGVKRDGHDEKYRWSSRDGIFNGLFGKKSIEVVYVVNNAAYAGHMTVSRVEKLLKYLPYTIEMRKEYCWDNEVAYSIRKI